MPCLKTWFEGRTHRQWYPISNNFSIISSSLSLLSHNKKIKDKIKCWHLTTWSEFYKHVTLQFNIVSHISYDHIFRKQTLTQAKDLRYFLFNQRTFNNMKPLCWSNRSGFKSTIYKIMLLVVQEIFLVLIWSEIYIRYDFPYQLYNISRAFNWP